MIFIKPFPSDTHIATMSAMITYAILQIDQYFVYPNLFLFICFFGVIIIELLTRFGVSKQQMEKKVTTDFQFESNIRSKLMILSLVFLALIFDWVAITTGFFSSSTTQSHFISRGALIYLIAHQGVQVMRNVYMHEGENIIPPILKWFAERLRDHDKDKWSGNNLPHRRPYDNEETLKKIAKEFEDEQSDKNKG